jgi:hypothetical protein
MYREGHFGLKNGKGRAMAEKLTIQIEYCVP